MTSIEFKLRPWKKEFFGKFDVPQTSDQIMRRLERNGKYFIFVGFVPKISFILSIVVRLFAKTIFDFFQQLISNPFTHFTIGLFLFKYFKEIKASIHKSLTSTINFLRNNLTIQLVIKSDDGGVLIMTNETLRNKLNKSKFVKIGKII